MTTPNGATLQKVGKVGKLEEHSMEVHNSRRPLDHLTLTLTLTLTFDLIVMMGEIS